jgi:hypothetical protein
MTAPDDRAVAIADQAHAENLGGDHCTGFCKACADAYLVAMRAVASLDARYTRLADAVRAELTHGGIRDRIAQSTSILGGESKPGSPVYRAAQRLDRDRNEFYERMIAALDDGRP